jgi:hypothetical protein
MSTGAPVIAEPPMSMPSRMVAALGPHAAVVGRRRADRAGIIVSRLGPSVTPGVRATRSHRVRRTTILGGRTPTTAGAGPAGRDHRPETGASTESRVADHAPSLAAPDQQRVAGA